MRLTCGTDIIEIKRIQKAIETQKKFIEKVYTKSEIDYCESKNNRYEHYAVRFAAKEAVYKALQKEVPVELTWKSIEISNDAKGRPQVQFMEEKPKKIASIDISLSHCKEYAVATVIIGIED